MTDKARALVDELLSLYRYNEEDWVEDAAKLVEAALAEEFERGKFVGNQEASVRLDAVYDVRVAEAVAADRASGCPCRCHWTTAQQMAINYCPRYTIAQQQERARGGEKP